MSTSDTKRPRLSRLEWASNMVPVACAVMLTAVVTFELAAAHQRLGAIRDSGSIAIERAACVLTEAVGPEPRSGCETPGIVAPSMPELPVPGTSR